MFAEIFGHNHQYLLQVSFRLVLSILLGAFIGSERARHGRAAGMRTHMLVCLGSALTSMIGLYIADVLGRNGDVLRISAQVISGIGFLGAGMIILKNNNTISGLTTAAGVWTTSIIGIAVGYGFYWGAVIATVLFLITIALFSKLEKRKKIMAFIYVEIDNMYNTNKVIDDISKMIGVHIAHHTLPPKSNCIGHLGINISFDNSMDFDYNKLCEIENVVFVEDDD